MKICSDVTKNTVTLLLRNDEIQTVIDSSWIGVLKDESNPNFRFEISRGREYVKSSFFGEGYLLISNYFKTLGKKAALEYFAEYIDFVNTENHSQEYILGFNNIFFDGEKLSFVKTLVPFEQSVKESVRYFVEGLAKTVGEIDDDLKKALLSACESSDETFSELKEVVASALTITAASERESFENAVTTSFDELDTVVLSKEEDEEAIESVVYEKPIQLDGELIGKEPKDAQVPELQKKVCPNCGAEYQNDYVFCIRCGATLAPVETEPTEAVEACPEEAPKDEVDVQLKTVEPEPQPETDETPKGENDPGLPYQETEQKEQEDVPAEAQTLSEPGKPTESVSKEAISQESKPEDSPVASPGEPNATAKGKMYGETTLLGFTNYGETSILGGGEIASFDTPNLVREMNGEKVFVTKRNFTIGKSVERADYTVKNNNAISRVHAEITVVGNEYYIIDKGSTNHTYVNDSMIQPESSVRIYDGDEIKLANEKFTFHLQ